MVRSWQTIEIDEERKRSLFSFLEIDLATSEKNSFATVEYQNFISSDDSSYNMISFAKYLSQFGVQAPAPRSILCLKKVNENCSLSYRYPGAEPPVFQNSKLISANCVESFLIKEAVEKKYLKVTPTDKPIISGDIDENELLKRIIDKMWYEDRILFVPGGTTDLRGHGRNSFEIDFVLPFNSDSAYLNQGMTKENTLAVINAGYYLHFDSEFADPLSYAHDPVGLVVTKGKVLSAPIYKRNALIFNSKKFAMSKDESKYGLGNTQPHIKSVSLRNLAVKFETGLFVYGEYYTLKNDQSTEFLRMSTRAELNKRNPKTETTFYNRLFDIDNGKTNSLTPKAQGRVEIIIVGSQIVAFSEHGGAYIPNNGYVISLPKNDLSLAIKELCLSGRGCAIEQFIDADLGNIEISSAVQVGPQLIENGKLTHAVVQESFNLMGEFVPLEADVEEGIPPVLLRCETAITSKLARAGFGIRRDGRCYVVTIEGTESRTYHPDRESRGGNLRQLAEALLQLGCQDAVALDGGGSAELIFRGQSMNRVSDRHEVPLLPSSRLLPGYISISHRKGKLRH